MTLAIAVTAVGLAGALLAERAGARAAMWLTKPVASAGFLLAAWLAGAEGSDYGRLILAGLVLSWLGDVLLIPRARAWFLAGLGAFLLAHVVYAVAFALRGVSPRATAVACVPIVVVGVLVLRWLRPHVPRRMRAPVVAYVVAISTMVALAIGTFAARGDLRVLAGAILFWISDLFVARNRFVSPGLENRVMGLPPYYAAQLLLAASCSFRGEPSSPRLGLAPARPPLSPASMTPSGSLRRSVVALEAPAQKRRGPSGKLDGGRRLARPEPRGRRHPPPPTPVTAP